jgi:hypothetical protein
VLAHLKPFKLVVASDLGSIAACEAIDYDAIDLEKFDYILAAYNFDDAKYETSLVTKEIK